MPETYECNSDGCMVTGCLNCGDYFDDADYHYCDTENCSSFRTQEEAQIFYERVLSNAGYDVHRLDRDRDCIACEHLN